MYPVQGNLLLYYLLPLAKELWKKEAKKSHILLESHRLIVVSYPSDFLLLLTNLSKLWSPKNRRRIFHIMEFELCCSSHIERSKCSTQD